MNRYKPFLINICKIENVTLKEIMELTGKSQSTVYKWLNFLAPDFPPIESLGKILFRLGMSFDDFINCHHYIYDNGKADRTYYMYYRGSTVERYIGNEILNSTNSKDVLKTYLTDREHLNNMIKNYLDGSEDIPDSFDFLCKALQPIFVSDIITDFEQSVFELNSQTLREYKLGLEILKETEENGDYESADLPIHQIYYPDANYVFLRASEGDIEFLKSYLSIIDDGDKRHILDCYMEICSECPSFDKKNKILKQLINKKCCFFSEKNKTSDEKYRELLKRILQIV